MRYITIAGVSKSLSDWATVAGITQSCLHMRLRNGWPPEVAVIRPSRNVTGVNYHSRGTAPKPKNLGREKRPAPAPRFGPPKPKVGRQPRRAGHFMVEHPLYRAWGGMRRRCTYPKHHRYSRYGARGITVCARWMDFWSFVDDVGIRPPGHSLDRIDNDGNYEPGNVRWATPKQQARNTRRNQTV